ncbi:vitelline membrane outer layer protein 1 homolog isoform X2 [Pyxicephalus adspersus]
MNYADIITVNNGGSRGDWGFMDYCPDRTLATGFILKVQKRRGWLLDDTALNAIGLFCTKNNSQNVIKQITSTVGDFGSWRSSFFCQSGFLKRFSLRVDQRRGDNTAANNIMFTCSNSNILKGNGMNWGYYGIWSEDCNRGICGIKTRVEGNRGKLVDDTALNDVQFLCCKT